MSPSARAEGWPPAVAVANNRERDFAGRATMAREVAELTVEYAGRVCLALARRLWRRLPAFWQRTRAARVAGSHVHALVLRYQPRDQNHSTFFFRNRPELAVLQHLLQVFPPNARLKLAILGCSKGAEVYSFAWSIRAARPDLDLTLSAVDISQDILDFAQQGVYSRRAFHAADDPSCDVSTMTYRDQCDSIFERMTADEMTAMFDVDANYAAVKPWLKRGIVWRRGDAADPGFAQRLGPHDVVVANRFLCHMKPRSAERCLRSVARLVKPGGHLFVSGVDLDVRTGIARESGWTPVSARLEDVHGGDPSLLGGWPLEYWALEPFDTRRADRDVRYASVFRIGDDRLEGDELDSDVSADGVQR